VVGKLLTLTFFPDGLGDLFSSDTTAQPCEVSQAYYKNKYYQTMQREIWNTELILENETLSDPAKAILEGRIEFLEESLESEEWENGFPFEFQKRK
jgi:hypothetical protein